MLGHGIYEVFWATKSENSMQRTNQTRGPFAKILLKTTYKRSHWGQICEYKIFLCYEHFIKKKIHNHESNFFQVINKVKKKHSLSTFLKLK